MDFVEYCEDHGIDPERMPPMAKDRLLYEISPEMRESCKMMIGLWLNSYDMYTKEKEEARRKAKGLFHKRKWEDKYLKALVKAHGALADAIDWGMQISWGNDDYEEVERNLLAHKEEYIEYYKRKMNA